MCFNMTNTEWLFVVNVGFFTCDSYNIFASLLENHYFVGNKIQVLSDMFQLSQSI